LRRTPLTDLFAARNKLNTSQLTSKLGNLKLNSPRLGSLGRRGKTLAYGGTALALAGIGGVTAAAATSAAPTPVGIAGTSHHLSVGDAAGVHFGLRVSVRPAAASASAAPSSTTVASAEQPGAVQAAVGSGHAKAAAGSGHAKAAAGSGHARAAGVQASGGSGHAHAARAKSPHVVRHGGSRSWKQIRDALASQTSPRPEPGKLPLADRLLTGPASGAQSYLPIGSSQMANATAIVHQALAKHMGLRAAVIAVATAMQESGLQNINYGDRDSLGLFQQRPSMGWGTASQITTPSYAADAFLSALAAHQKADPGWAGEPLWATAQAVQKSGFPYAYAKWEKQAAQLVTTIATKLG
jgi:hypothetical protein